MVCKLYEKMQNDMLSKSFINIKKIITNTLGVDQDVASILIFKGWSIVKGPVSICFILKYLSPEMQGFWYTFISLSALKVFAELGFTTIISQFVSHEFAHLKEVNKKIEGSNKYKDRLFSLIRFSIKLYLIVIPVAIVVLMIVGYYFFHNNDKFILCAWFIYAITGGVSLLISLLQSIYQGLNKVKTIQINILIGSILLTTFNWFLLFENFTIWALVLGGVFSNIVLLILLYRISPPFWKQLIKYKIVNSYNWFHDIIKLQGKYAISWISGYFIFSLYVPVLFKYEGAVISGKFGLTMTLINAIQGLSLAWLTAKIPIFNIYISRGQRSLLNSSFKKNLIIGGIVFVSSSLVLIMVMFLSNYYNYYNDRLLTTLQVTLLLIYYLENYIVGSLAIYLRAHKDEPFYILSFAAALFIALNLIISLKYFDLTTVLIIQVIVSWIVFFPWAFMIYKKNKKYNILWKSLY